MNHPGAIPADTPPIASALGGQVRHASVHAKEAKPLRWAAVAEGETITAASQEAGDHADAHVLTTLLLASALFFAGLTTSFRLRFACVLLLAGSSLTLAYAAARLIDLPIA